MGDQKQILYGGGTPMLINRFSSFKKLMCSGFLRISNNGNDDRGFQKKTGLIFINPGPSALFIQCLFTRHGFLMDFLLDVLICYDNKFPRLIIGG